jgi:hypothetical protein
MGKRLNLTFAVGKRWRQRTGRSFKHHSAWGRDGFDSRTGRQFRQKIGTVKSSNGLVRRRESRAVTSLSGVSSIRSFPSVLQLCCPGTEA